MQNGKLNKGDILTVPEVAEYLRCHPSTVYRMLKHSQIPGFRVGSDWRFSKGAIDKWRDDAESAGYGR